MPRILIADDHQAMRQALLQMLQEEFPGVYTEPVEDTENLVRLALEADWDIIISDLAMPGGGGMMALQQIKAQKPSVPFIMISTHAADQYEEHTLRAGADHFISKEDLMVNLPELLHRLL
ncbi:response regulator transcription factor [Flavihumibacter solisilvae]|jgi:DNA-binding NarL/FixJ family response regulator|uniref:response regulator transcription factor n=1 Tax=Flavihumibacter solisilvae TaxID=1349421 RepID=UPI00068BED9B|nr:response regulator transcription factor [Flavihumibacter solisilvae]